MAKKENEMTIGEMLEYFQAADMLYEFYDNQMQANENEPDNKALYEEGKILRKKYHDCKYKLINEIKEKVDSIC